MAEALGVLRADVARQALLQQRARHGLSIDEQVSADAARPLGLRRAAQHAQQQRALRVAHHRRHLIRQQRVRRVRQHRLQLALALAMVCAVALDRDRDVLEEQHHALGRHQEAVHVDLDDDAALELGNLRQSQLPMAQRRDAERRPHVVVAELDQVASADVVRQEERRVDGDAALEALQPHGQVA